MYTATALTSLLALASSTLAISITSPPTNYVQDITQPLRIEWTSVNTDPDTINIELVNFSRSPNFNKTLFTNVQTKQSFIVAPANEADGQTGTGFQINFSGTQGNNIGILAQSQQFTLVNGGGSSTSSAGGSGSSTTATTPGSTGGSVPFPVGNGTTTGGSGGAGATGAGGSPSASPSQFSSGAGSVGMGVGAVAAVAVGLAALFA